MNSTRSLMRCLSACAVLFIGLMGCANQPYKTASDFGKSVRQAWQSQTLNPEAGKVITGSSVTMTPVESDGVTSKSAIERYQSTFVQPPPSTNVLNIGLGGTSSATGR